MKKPDKKYIEELMKMIAEECNVKEVVIKKNDL